VETIIELARELGYVTPAEFGRLEALVTELGVPLWLVEEDQRRCFSAPFADPFALAPHIHSTPRRLGVYLDVSASEPV